MDRTLFGFLNVYKPVGMTSHDVVSVLRRTIKIKQIGHTGTLDPFAEGVLPIAIGKATRLIEYLSDDKAYVGRFCFGKSTTTYDIEGEIVKTFNEITSEAEILTNLSKFQGEIEQIPPIYSAKKVNGKKLYEYARNGKDLNDIKIKPSKVTIYKTELMEFNEEEQWADIYIECSKGTYIRSIANDLGKYLNSGCYLSKLKRTKAGNFKIDNSVRLDNLTVSVVEKEILNPINYLPQPQQELNDVEYDRIITGKTIYNRINKDEGIVILTKSNKIIAIAQASQDGLKPKKVFTTE